MQDGTWVFGYGSLIFRADFPWSERRRASIRGWSRRFWQGSHDHRGRPHAPGRVVTLIPERDAVCAGMAYHVDGDTMIALDYREKNGYQRVEIELRFDDDSRAEGIVYVADESNPAFLGPAPLDEIAAHVACSDGPSGHNRDYVLDLHRALEEIGTFDEHVHSLATLLIEQHS